jgi:hypothetical protein
MRKEGLLAPQRTRHRRRERPHTGTITTTAPNTRWGTDATRRRLRRRARVQRCRRALRSSEHSSSEAPTGLCSRNSVAYPDACLQGWPSPSYQLLASTDCPVGTTPPSAYENEGGPLSFAATRTGAGTGKRSIPDVSGSVAATDLLPNLTRRVIFQTRVQTANNAARTTKSEGPPTTCGGSPFRGFALRSSVSLSARVGLLGQDCA